MVLRTKAPHPGWDAALVSPYDQYKVMFVNIAYFFSFILGRTVALFPILDLLAQIAFQVPDESEAAEADQSASSGNATLHTWIPVRVEATWLTP